MARGLTLLLGAGLGAGLMYLFDPERGNRRRALLGDQLNHLMNVTSTTASDLQEQVKNRAQGLKAETRAQLTQEPVPDATLVARVREKMGHDISHPGSVQVTAHNGNVTLSGPILSGEVSKLIADIQLIPGVKNVTNKLDVHATPDGVPGLQGSGKPS